MALQVLNPDNTSSINQQFRAKRFQLFKSLLDTLPRPVKILDVGGTESYWKNMGFVGSSDYQITLLNLRQIDTTLEGFTSEAGDACDLSQYADKHFDIVFSNSVIEHLFTFENQTSMAHEIQRVGKNYLVQTPYKYFPIEPHWLFPLFQFLPFSTRVFLTRNFALGHFSKAATLEAAKTLVSEVRLLNRKEMQNLFFDGKMYEEKFLGLTKSLTMYKFSN